jgi:hypothetical protein
MAAYFLRINLSLDESVNSTELWETNVYPSVTMKSTIILDFTPCSQLSYALNTIASLRYDNISPKELRTIQNIVNNFVYFFIAGIHSVYCYGMVIDGCTNMIVYKFLEEKGNKLFGACLDSSSTSTG